MKKVIILLLVLQCQTIPGQTPLAQIIDNLAMTENPQSAFNYYDSAEKEHGYSLENEVEILDQLNLPSDNNKAYYITGKYEINNLIVVFISDFSPYENVHFALLFDKSFNLVDKLEATAYENDEGFHSVKTWIDYNILTINNYNIYNRPEYRTKKYSITNKGFKPINDQVIINAPSGLRVRNKPTINSTILTTVPNLGVFDYLSANPGEDTTSVIDNGQALKNNWLAIAAQDSTHQLGYVFGAFAKRHIEVKTNDYKVIIDEISKKEFQLLAENHQSNSPVQKIDDLEKIKQLLAEQLIGEHDAADNYTIKKIVADNQKEIRVDQDECNIIGYYPQYHYLLLECGHSTDYLIDLKNGADDINRIGNPDFYCSSPQSTFRLNGFYNGQSNVYFLEKLNEHTDPEFLFVSSSLIQSDYLEKYFWKDNNTIVVKVEGMYFKIQLIAL